MVNYCNENSGRITSELIVIEYLPRGVVATHVQTLRIDPTVTSGTFQLWVNGNYTTSITFNSTIATLLTSINSALDALPNLAAGEIVATGASSAAITLTALANGWYTIRIFADALVGNTSSNPSIETTVVTQGSKMYRISGELSDFSYENMADLVDMTGMSDAEERQKATLKKMTFSASLYKSPDADFVYAIEEGECGYLYVYEQGKTVGMKYFAFAALFDKVSFSVPSHDKIEGELSGVRNGPMIVPFYTVYKG